MLSTNKQFISSMARVGNMSNQRERERKFIRNFLINGLLEFIRKFLINGVSEFIRNFLINGVLQFVRNFLINGLFECISLEVTNKQFIWNFLINGEIAARGERSDRKVGVVYWYSIQCTVPLHRSG
jgi:hypothetical protein